MSFHLIVIPPKDETYRVTNLPSRDSIRGEVLRQLRVNDVRHRAGGMTFAESVSTAQVGAVVTHADSGFSFKVEEV